MSSFLLIFFVSLTSPAHAAPKVQCCNTATGTWISTPTADACSAMPDHVPYSPATTQQVLACFQSTQQLAGQEMNAILAPTRVRPPDCCDTRTRKWLGSTPEAACVAGGGVPNTPENLDATEACRGPVPAPVWRQEDYEPNIPNGGMERWKDENRPEGFTTMGFAPSVGSPFPMQTVFRTTDAHTGSYAVRLKNFDMTAALLQQGMPAQAAAMVPQQSSPALLSSCKEPCPTETGKAPSGTGMATVAQVMGNLPVDEAKSHVCGAYKGFIADLDQVAFTTVLVRGSTVVGGTAMTDPNARFTRSSKDWITFALPLHTRGAELAQVDAVGIQALVQPRGSTGSFTGQVSNQTDITLDSVHFCDLMDLSIHHPAVVSAGQEAIPDDVEATEGAQTWLNEDNDDGDASYDRDDRNGVEDDELVQVKMRLPLESAGKVTLALTGASKVALWDDRHKTVPFTQLGKAVDVGEFMTLAADGSSLERIVYVEGIEPSTGAADIRFDFTFDDRSSSGDDFEDTVALTVLAVDRIEWQGKKNSVDDGDTLDPDPNWPAWPGAAVRVFPGRRFAGREPEATARDVVTGRVHLNVAPVRPIPLFVRAFDVDDPTALDDVVDDEREADDNRGRTPHSWGAFVGSEATILQLDAAMKVTELGFQVTLQPGDNFRLLASGDADFLERLHNDDTKLLTDAPRLAAAIVDPDVLAASKTPSAALVPRLEATASPVLTVWRHLHLEVDSMGPVPKEVLTAKITGQRVDSRTDATTLYMWLTLNRNLYDALPEASKSGRAGFVDNYADGTLTQGSQKYRIVESTAKGPGVNDEVLIRYPASLGQFTDADRKAPVTLIDDDATLAGQPLPALQTAGIAPAFAKAYVAPRFDVPNPTPTAPFVLHFLSDEQRYLQDLFRPTFDNVQHHEEEQIWVAYLLNAFQGKLSEDDDPNGEGAICGQADGNPDSGAEGFGAAVFQESGLETQRAYTAKGHGVGWQLQDVAPHELAHLFGAKHDDGGVMSYALVKTADFEPITLDRIRSADGP